MCGLFGWYRAKGSTIPDADVLLLTKVLLVLNQQRGSDSTGIASWRVGEETPTLDKGTEAATSFLLDRADDVAAACRPGTGWLLGHTRSKTQGEVTPANAHPFQYGDLVGAHNGMVSNYAQLAATAERLHLPGCDSAAIFAAASQHGMVKTLAAASGSFNLAWSEAPYTTIRLYQDEAGGLALVCVPQWRMVIWSSVDEHIKLACALLNLPVIYDKAGEAPGYYMALPEKAIIVLDETRLIKGACTWEEIKAPTQGRYLLTGGYGYGYAAQDRQPDTRHAPTRGYHPSVLAQGIYHKGKRRLCSWCRDYAKSSHARRSTQPGVVDVLVTPPHGHGISRVTVSPEWPPRRCPNCQTTGRVQAVVDGCGDSFDCLACGVALELADEWYGENGYDATLYQGED